MFQNFYSLTKKKKKKISINFYSPFSPFTRLLLYMHLPITFHVISSQIHQTKKDFIYLLWHLDNFNIVILLDLCSYELAITKEKGTCVFYSVTTAYGFDVEVRYYGFCKICD